MAPELVRDLLATHAALIADLRGRLEGHRLYRPSADHDELWALRFLLSHKLKPAKAAAAIESALEFRDKNGLDAIRQTVATTPQTAWPSNNRVVPWTGVSFYQPAPDGVVIVTGRLTEINMKGLMEHVDRDTYRDAIFHLNEWIAHHLDVTTRRTGTLTKCFRIFDASNMTVSGFHLGFVRRRSPSHTAPSPQLPAPIPCTHPSARFRAHTTAESAAPLCVHASGADGLGAAEPAAERPPAAARARDTHPVRAHTRAHRLTCMACALDVYARRSTRSCSPPSSSSTCPPPSGGSGTSCCGR